MMSTRVVRAWIGLFVIVTDLAIFFIDHVLQDQQYELMELAAHGAFLVLGLLLIDPKLAKPVMDRIMTLLPGGKAK
jgi:hypothetical protein